MIDEASGRAIGIVRALDKTMSAPLSGRACVVYRVRTRFGAREHLAIVPFLVEADGGEVVVVDGDHARVVLPATPRDVHDARLVQRTARFLGVGARRLREIVVAPGDRVAVTGIVMRDALAAPDERAGYRDLPPARIRITGTRAAPLRIRSA